MPTSSGPVFHWLDWVAVLGYIALALGVGTWLAKRASRSTKDFYLAGRSLPWWVAGTSIVATTFAADTPLVITGWVRTAGIAQNWLWWGFATGGALSFLVLAGWWRRLAVTTDAEILERRYGGNQAKALRGFFGVYHALVTNTIVLVWVLVAMKKLVRVVLDLPDTSQDGWILAGGVVLALTYSFMSGFWGVVVTDFFQFFLAMFGALLLAFMAAKELGGLEGAREAFAELPQKLTTFVPGRAVGADGTTLGWLDAAAWATGGFGAFLIFFALQGIFNKNADGGGAGIQRYSACRDENHARKAALLYHIAHYALRPWPWIFVALASLILVQTGDLPIIEKTGQPDHEAAYPVMMSMLLGPGLFGLMCASFLAAFMSTLDTHFNLASAYLVNDFYRRFVARKKGPRHYVWVGRFAEILIGGVAGLMAWHADSISGLFTMSLSLLGGLGPALLLRWFWWRANAWTEISAMLTSTSMTLLFETIKASSKAAKESVPAAADYPLSYIWVVLASITVMLVVTLLTPPVERDKLQAFHDRVRPIGWWRPLSRGESQPVKSFLVGWAGGAALIYGLVFLIGAWMLGRPLLNYAALTLIGGVALKWAWPRVLRPSLLGDPEVETH